MIMEYMDAAMHLAKYKILEDGSFYGAIPECNGVWANELTLEATRDDLRSTLEGWILLGIDLGDELPLIAGIDLNVHEVAEAN